MPKTTKQAEGGGPKVAEGAWPTLKLTRRSPQNRPQDMSGFPRCTCGCQNEAATYIPVSALLSDEVVERVAAALHDEQEYREPTGEPPEGWCPPGHDVHQEPPREPVLWAEMVANGEFPGTQDEFRKDARAALQGVLEVQR